MPDFDEEEFERSLRLRPSSDDLDEEAFEASLRTPVKAQSGAGARLLARLDGADEAAAAREAELQAEYGGLGGKVVTGVQGALDSLSLGASSAVSERVQGAILGKQLDEDGYKPPQLTPEARARMADPAVRARMAEMGVTEIPAEQSNFDIGRETAKVEGERYSEANPTTDVVSRVGGAALPALFTGGASTAATGGSMLARGGRGLLRYSPAGVAQRAGEAVTGRLLGTGAGLARTAGAYAAGEVAENAIGTLALEASQLRASDIENPEEAAEHLVSALGYGSLLSGFAGGVMGGGSKLLRRGAGAVDELGAGVPKPGAVDGMVAQAGSRVDSHIGALDELDAYAKQVPEADVATRNAIDQEGGAILHEATSEIEQRPLSAAAIPEPQRGKWQAVAERAQAAGGKFKEAVDTGTRAARQDFDEVLRGMDQIDEYGGIAAKQRANQFNVGHAVDSAPVDALLADMHGEIAGFMAGRSRTALASGGGLNALESVKKVMNENGALIRGALGRGDVGEAYNLLDQGVKGFLGKARGSARAEPVKDLIERMYPKIQGFLEDEASWGDLAVRQKLANPSWSNRIGVSMDGRIQGLTTIAGERKANLFDNIKLANSGGLESLFNRLGDAGTEDVEQAFRTHLRAMARDATDRTRAWGTDKLRGEATRVVGAVKRIEDTMDRVALLRRDKLAHEASLQGSTIQAIGQLAGNLGFGAVGGAIGAGVAAKRKLVEMLGQATDPGQRAAIAAAIPPPTQLEQTVAATRQSMGARLANSAALLSQAVTSTASTPFATGAMLSEEKHQQAIQQAVALNNPGSPEAAALYEQAAQLEEQSPALADAFAQSKLKMASYITSRLPKPASTAMYAPPPQHDPVTERKLRRTVAAAQDPAGAIDRMSRMQASPEDVETIRTLFPSMYRAYQQNVKKALANAKVKPNLQARMRLQSVLGLPIEPTMVASELTFLQQVAHMPDQKKAAEAKAEAKNIADAKSMGNPYGTGNPKFRDADATYSAPVDARIDRR